MPSNVFGYINNYVTINTTQTITGAKTFDHDLICNSDIYCVNLYGNATTATYAEVANNILGGGAGRIPFNTAVSTTNFTERGNVGQLLRSNGSSGPTWTSDISATTVQINTTVPADVYNIPFCSGTGSSQTLLSDIILQYDTTLSPPQISSDLNGNASTATEATNIAGGGAGRIPFNTANGITSFTALGTAGQFLTSAGTGTPTWTPNNFVTLTGASQTITGEKIFDDKIIMNDYLGSGNTTTIHQNGSFLNMSLNSYNTSVVSITGLIPSQNLQCLVRTDNVQQLNPFGSLTGTNITNSSNLFIASVINSQSGIIITSYGVINSNSPLQIGTTFTSKINLWFALGTYVTADLGNGNYSISPNALIASYVTRLQVLWIYNSLSRVASAAAANGAITLDYSTSINLQCVNLSAVMLNAISIKASQATSKVDIYGNLQLYGSLQYNYGGIITSSRTLTFPIAQFYLITSNSGFSLTITLPPISAAQTGTTVIFKRYNASSTVLFECSGTNLIVGAETDTPATGLTFGSSNKQCTLVIAENIWFQMY